MCKYKCKTSYSFTRHYESKHGVVVSEKEPYNISKINAPDKEAEIAQNKKHHRKGDTSIIQQTLFKEHPEDTKSLEFVNTHKTNCNNQIIPSRKLFDFKPGKSKKKCTSAVEQETSRRIKMMPTYTISALNGFVATCANTNASSVAI